MGNAVNAQTSMLSILRVQEISMILEGREQARAGRLSPLKDAIDRFKAGGMLPADVDAEEADATSE